MEDGVLSERYPGRMARYGSLLLLDFYVDDPTTQDPTSPALAVADEIVSRRHAAMEVVADLVGGGGRAPRAGSPRRRRDPRGSAGILRAARESWSLS